ncbi:DUF2861 family protein [Vibrio tritonius]|uniref:DUF2861 family protein n=1 Tax=Vibrio tritonius TaxID=1435069 RepID=A0ABS7YP53_9VIBR|nr:DUF2861 family protein [Vibrio tritonius]MCA2017455.1 DUF2861 family protein [Vibrio tritonius]
MKKSLLLLGTSLCVPLTSHAADWFEQSTPLTQAHQHLLDGDLQSMFTSLVEVWQLDQEKNIKDHLNSLLVQSLSVDCGKGLDSKQFPDWINSITIRRLNIQSPGRDAYQMMVNVAAKKEISDIRLSKWVDKDISSDTSFNSVNSDNVTNGIYSYVKRYNLNNDISKGLYRIDVTADDQESWSAWVIFSEQNAKQTVRWASKDHWQIEKNALLNKFCPLPKLGVSVYDYVKGKYQEIWNHSYDSDYPTSLPVDSLPPDRYVLAISMTQQRWQGPIIIEQSQVISKTYDVATEE